MLFHAAILCDTILGCTVLLCCIILYHTMLYSIILCYSMSDCHTPSPPTKSCPMKSPWVKLSGGLPMKFNGHENSHPLEFRVCLSQTL